MSLAHKTTFGRTSQHTPSVTPFNGGICIAWTGTDNHLNVAMLTIGANSAMTMGTVRTSAEQSPFAPSLITDGSGALGIAWTGMTKEHIYLAGVDVNNHEPLSNRQELALAVKSAAGPSYFLDCMGFIAGAPQMGLRLAYAGSDDLLYLLTAVSFHVGPTPFLRLSATENSKHVPANCQTNNIIWTDRQNNLRSGLLTFSDINDDPSSTIIDSIRINIPTTVTPGSSSPAVVNTGAPNPNAAPGNGNLIICFRDDQSNLYKLALNPLEARRNIGSVHQPVKLTESSDYAPALCKMNNGSIYVAWIGQSNNQINIAPLP
jgi:hypothetical protein